MGKLIFAASSTILEQQYPGVIGNNASAEGFTSISITDDGYFYTHGQKFRLYKVVNNVVEGLSLQWAGASGNLQLLDGNTELASLAVVGNIVGDSIITATRDSNDAKKYTLTHKQPQNLVSGSYGSNVTLNNVAMPTITIDSYGHIIAISTTTIDTTKVKATALTNENGYYYLLGTTGTDIQSPKYSSNIKIDKDGNLHASAIYENGTLLSNKYAVKAQATDAVTGTVLLSDAIDGTADAETGHTAATPLAVKNAIAAANTYAASLFSENDALVFVGTINAAGVFQSHNSQILENVIDGSTTINSNSFVYKAGYTMKFTQAGTIILGETGYEVTFTVEPGDVLLCVNDKKTTFKGSDFTVIQNNIDGSLTSASLLNGILFANNSRSIDSLAFPSDGDGYLKFNATSEVLEWVAKSALWRTFYNGSTSGTTIQNKNIILKSATGQSTTDPLVITFGTESGQGTITYTINPKAIANSALENLTLIQNSTQFEYNATTAKSLTIGAGLVLSSVNDVWTLDHAPHTQITTSKLGAITTDASGHITSFTEVTALSNPNALYIGVGGTVTSLPYDGSSKVGYNFVAGTDVSITPTYRNADSGMIYSGSDKTEVIDLTIGFTHKYRPVSILTPSLSDYTETSILTDLSSGTLKLRQGTHVSLTAAEGGIVNIASSWRPVYVYTPGASGLTQGQLGDTSSLVFSQDFIVSNDELGLCWTEIDANGNITYVK